jgi:nicotinate-nucleotide pyrophosphorylase (carboxylating)
MTNSVHAYPQISHLDPAYVLGKISEFRAEDFPSGDLTTNLTGKSGSGSAAIVSKSDGIFCGVDVLPYCFPETCRVDLTVSDGMELTPGLTLAHIAGPTDALLANERLALNLIQHLCGIATHARSIMSKNIPDGFKVLDTRKTTPGLRMFEKYAVAVGGASNHRLDLSSGILIKDNHIQSAGSLKNAVTHANASLSNGSWLELEVDTIEQLQEGLDLGIKAFLLDNMKPDTVKKAVSIVRSRDNGESIFLEASGGINPETIEEYAATGIDAVSMSSLTFGSSPLDISMDFH